VLDASEQSMNERNEQLDEYNCNAQLHAVVVVVRSEVVVAASRAACMPLALPLHLCLTKSCSVIRQRRRSIERAQLLLRWPRAMLHKSNNEKMGG